MLNMSKVLTLGGSSGTALLAIVRSLGRQGIEVHSAWREPSPWVDRSRFLTRTWDLPAYDPADDGWREALAELVQRERFDLVIPVDDPALLPLQAHKVELAAAGRFYLLGDSAFEIAFNKARTYELAAELGLPLPRQEQVDDCTDLPGVASRLGLPVVVKPCSTFALDNLAARRDVRRAYRLDDLHDSVAELVSTGPVLLQENFIGTGLGVGVLASEGELLVAFQYARVHEPPEGGGSSYRRSEALDPDLEDAARRIVAALRHTGVMMIELKVNSDRSRWIVVELNGRFWGALPLAVAAGADFPYYLYQLLVEGRTEFPRSYRSGIYARNWSRDVRWLRANARADRSDPVLIRRSMRRVAGEFANVARVRERSDTFAVDDPLPAAGELLKIADAVAGRAVRRAGDLAAEHLAFARAVRRRRLIDAMLSARHVAFVCHGNVSRSPFAERYARTKAPHHVEIMSAGCLPSTGRSSPAAAIAASHECDVDLTQHRSRTLTPDLIDWADILLVFDRAQRSAIARTFPAGAAKIHYLGAADAVTPMEISDPHGHDLEFFRMTFGRIRSAIDLMHAEAWTPGASPSANGSRG
jgi:protein-tyrosine-phosphatase/predicted ATP-grasp superfamily ATP-dependent carboligase